MLAHLQALFPSPFYFFDEVDCALDSLAAGRVAAFVRAQCNGSSSRGKAAAALAASKADASADGDCTLHETAGDSSNIDGQQPIASNGARVAAKRSSTADAVGDDIACGVGAQYLLVSHRPVVFESAGCLLGVYSNGRGSSAAVVAHF
jgi:hypothetical protein